MNSLHSEYCLELTYILLNQNMLYHISTRSQTLLQNHIFLLAECRALQTPYLWYDGHVPHINSVWVGKLYIYIPFCMNLKTSCKVVPFIPPRLPFILVHSSFHIPTQPSIRPSPCTTFSHPLFDQPLTLPTPIYHPLFDQPLPSPHSFLSPLIWITTPLSSLPSITPYSTNHSPLPTPFYHPLFEWNKGVFAPLAPPHSLLSPLVRPSSPSSTFLLKSHQCILFSNRYQLL